MSPKRSEPDEQEIAGSAISLVAQAGQKFARGMVFRIADDCYANPEKRGEVAFRNRFRRVIGAFGVHVRLKFAQQRIYVELVENHHVIHGSQSGHQRRARAFRENGSAFALSKFRVLASEFTPTMSKSPSARAACR